VAGKAAGVWLDVWRAQSGFGVNGKPWSNKLSRMSSRQSGWRKLGMIDRTVSDMIKSRLLELELAKQNSLSQLNTARYSFSKYFKQGCLGTQFP
jgi:hypothetical protein